MNHHYSRAVETVFIGWALGVIFGEGVIQTFAIVGLVLAGAGVVKGWVRVPADLRRFVAVAGALALWQAVSPALALLDHAADRWPKSGRYGQCLDTLGTVTAGLLGTVAVPWVALAWVLGVGWVTSTALGFYQHAVRWHFAQPFFVRTPIWRVQEPFGTDGSEAFAAGGFLFHRLRFAHAAVATLGLTLARAARGASLRQRASALLGVGVLLEAIYLSYARAALGAALLVVGLALLVFLRGASRQLGVAAVLAMVLAVSVSASWRVRFVKARDNLFDGERRLAMSVGWDLIRAHPVVGVGFGNHKPAAYATHGRTGINEILSSDSHDILLTTWAETGLVGLGLWLGYHLLLARALWRRARGGSWVASGALLSWTGFQLLGLVHYLPYHSGVHLTFALVWGLGLSPAIDAGSHKGRRSSARPGPKLQRVDLGDVLRGALHASPLFFAAEGVHCGPIESLTLRPRAST